MFGSAPSGRYRRPARCERQAVEMFLNDAACPDQLGDKLREPRLHRVIVPLLAGSIAAVQDLLSDDLQ